MKIIRTIDWGAYVGYQGAIQLPWRQLIDFAGVRGFICKGCQEDIANGYSTQLNLHASRAAGIEINGCYYWHYPTGSPSFWLDVYSKAIDLERPDFIAVDIEQWWGEGGVAVAPQQISDTAQALAEGLASRYPEKRVIVYSRQNFPLQFAPMMDKWLPAFDGGWVASWPDYGLKVYRMSWAEIAANKMRMAYDGSVIDLVADGWQPSILKAWTDWKIWQYSSRILLPADVGAEFDHQYDWNIIRGSVEEIKAWARKEEPVTTPANIYKTDVAPGARAWLGWSSDDDKDVDVAALSAGTDGLMFSMCSQVAPGMLVDKDTAFKIRAGRATVPAIGIIGLDADLFWKKEIDLPTFQDTNKRNMWTNETLRAILEQWRSNPIPQAEWDARKLNISAKDGGWIPLSALVLHMSTTTYTAGGSKINGMWQQAVVDDLLKPLTTLMQGGYIPAIKIYLMANSAWYPTYAGDSGWMPGARIASGQLAGLGIMRMWHQTEAGLPADAPMATPAATVQELRQYVPAASYQYPFLYLGINFRFFVYSYDRLRAISMFYPGGIVTPLTCAIWCDTANAMDAELGWAGPDTQPPDTGLTIEQRLDRLEAWAKKFPAFE